MFYFSGCETSSEESLSVKLRAGGMPETTAMLVEACSAPSEENDQHYPFSNNDQVCLPITVSPPQEMQHQFPRHKRHTSDSTNPTTDSLSLRHPLKHSRQISESMLRDLRDEDDMDVASQGSSTLPRASRPSSIASPSSSSHRSTLVGHTLLHKVYLMC